MLRCFAALVADGLGNHRPVGRVKSDRNSRGPRSIAVQDVDRWLKIHWSTGEYREASAAAPPRPDL